MKSLWLVAISILCAVLSTAAEPTSIKMKIGVILALSGEGAPYSKTIRSGIELGLESLPEPLRSQVEVKFDDDALDPKRTISAFQMLLNWGADAVINFSSGTAHAIAPTSRKG